jgi:hypothetical protein
MAARVALVLVLALYLSGTRIPGRYELFNPDVEITGTAKRGAAKRAWMLPSA